MRGRQRKGVGTISPFLSLPRVLESSDPAIQQSSDAGICHIHPCSNPTCSDQSIVCRINPSIDSSLNPFIHPSIYLEIQFKSTGGIRIQESSDPGVQHIHPCSGPSYQSVHRLVHRPSYQSVHRFSHPSHRYNSPLTINPISRPSSVSSSSVSAVSSMIQQLIPSNSHSNSD